jgi:hypothetical protein
VAKLREQVFSKLVRQHHSWRSALEQLEYGRYLWTIVRTFLHNHSHSSTHQRYRSSKSNLHWSAIPSYVLNEYHDFLTSVFKCLYIFVVWLN